MADGLTLGDLRLEVKARCPKFLTDTRANMFVNQAYLQICSAVDWDFLHTTVTGAAPLALTRPQTILSVVDSTNNLHLQHLDRRTVIDTLDPSVSQTGQALYWWLEVDTVKVFPVSTTTLSVRLVQQPATLALDADQVSVPLRFNDVLIDLATAKALRASGEEQQGRAAQQDADAGLERMRAALLSRNHSGPDYIVVYGGEQL